jgi:integrase
MLERVVFPAIGKLPVREITPHHILKTLQETAKPGTPTVAAEARRTISPVFELVVATLRADSDPVWPVRKAIPANKTQHKQAVNPQQIGKLLSCFGNSRGSYQVNYCMWLMWLWWTLARPVEATEAEWIEFDLDNALWTIPLARMKGRREHVIPLPFQAVKMLRTLQGLTGHRQHLFPGRDNPLGPMTSHSLRQLLKSLGWSGIYSFHVCPQGSMRLATNRR